MLSSDTSAEAERLQVALWRRMSSLDKVRAVNEISRAVQELALEGIRIRHPEASAREQRLRLAVLMLGRPLASTVYPEITSLGGR